MTIHVGDVLPDFGFTISDNATGALADPASFTVALTAPDGTTPTVTATNVGTGLRTVTHAATMAGRYRAVGTAVGNGCDGVSVLVWDVEAVSPGGIISLSDAQSFLGAPRDAEAPQVQACIDAASDVVENYCGRVWRLQTVTEFYDGGKSALNLRSTPVASITTVTESGTTVASTGYVLDANSGQLYRGTTAGAQDWSPGVQNVTVTYVAGASSIPEPVTHATKQVLRLLWTERNGSSARAASDDYAGPADLIPRPARLMLDPYRAPGF